VKLFALFAPFGPADHEIAANFFSSLARVFPVYRGQNSEQNKHLRFTAELKQPNVKFLANFALKKV
jgi:hypothetical protein